LQTIEFDVNKKIYFWGESYLFSPTLSQKFISFLLLPLTAIYCFLTFLKKSFSKPTNFSIPIISVGNLIVGGSGKTPITIELAKRYSDVAIILRGYKRDSKGLVVVSDKGDIKVDVNKSGDEAMLLANSLPKATVIVSEDRKKAIKKAKKLGAKLIFLDDGFSKFDIKKFDILLKPKLKLLPFCLPSGAYRFSPKNYKKVDLVLEEEKEFKREVKIKNKTNNMILLTAISKPQRLEKFLPYDMPKIYLPDHSEFSKEFIEEILTKYNPSSILTTTKDAVKLKSYNLMLSILELSIMIDSKSLEKIDSYIRNFNAKED
jgi:tetraacyldisaccharide 4'-kinase